MLSVGLLMMWSGWGSTNPVTTISDVLSGKPISERQARHNPLSDTGSGLNAGDAVSGGGIVGRSSPVTAGGGAVNAANAAFSAGFRGVSLIVAIAVAGAESNYNATSVSPTGDYGLWQINKAAHPQMMTNVFDPNQNARYAYQISAAGTNWGAWSAYKNGAYRSHLNEAKDAAKQVSGYVNPS